MMKGRGSDAAARIRVLVITPQYAPDFGPSAPIYTALCEDLQQIGCDVTVITAFPHYAGASARFRQSNRYFHEEMLNGVRVIRTYVYAVPKGALWRRLLYHASFNISATLALTKTRRPDVVLADAPTLWSGLPLLLMSTVLSVPFIYVVHDIYPDVLSRLGIVRGQRILKLIGSIEQFFYERAARISVLSNGFRDNLVGKGVKEDKIAVIPVCVDVDFMQPCDRQNPISEYWGLNGKFIVLYAGNIGLSQGLETTLGAAQMLRDQPEIQFVLVGEGATKAELQKKVAEDCLANVRFAPFQPREMVPMVYASSDVCLVSLKGDIVVESVPSKTYSIMACGRPIIATIAAGTEVGRLLSEAQCGFCVEPENPRALADGILKLYHNDALRKEMGLRGRDYVVAHYPRRAASIHYYNLIQQASRDQQ